MDRCTRQQYSQLYLGQFALLSLQSGALKRGANRDFHPIPVPIEKWKNNLADWRLFWQQLKSVVLDLCSSQIDPVVFF